MFKNEVFCTVISGVLVFFISQLFIEYILKPIQKYKSLKAKVAYCLTYYGNTYRNPIDVTKIPENKKLWWDEASTELRKIAAELEAFTVEKPFISFFLPKKDKILEAKSGLIGLSNSMYSSSGNDLRFVLECEDEIRKSLALSAR